MIIGQAIPKPYQRDASKLTLGNLAIARMPTGGTWSLSTDLTISGSDKAVIHGISMYGAASLLEAVTSTSLTLGSLTRAINIGGGWSETGTGNVYTSFLAMGEKGGGGGTETLELNLDNGAIGSAIFCTAFALGENDTAESEFNSPGTSLLAFYPIALSTGTATCKTATASVCSMAAVQSTTVSTGTATCQVGTGSIHGGLCYAADGTNVSHVSGEYCIVGGFNINCTADYSLSFGQNFPNSADKSMKIGWFDAWGAGNVPPFQVVRTGDGTVAVGINTDATPVKDLEFVDGEVYIDSPADGDLDIVADDELKLKNSATTRIEIDSTGIGFFNTAPVAQQLKANHNNWAAVSDVVNALVNLGLFDQA